MVGVVPILQILLMKNKSLSPIKEIGSRGRFSAGSSVSTWRAAGQSVPIHLCCNLQSKMFDLHTHASHCSVGHCSVCPTASHTPSCPCVQSFALMFTHTIIPTLWHYGRPCNTEIADSRHSIDGNSLELTNSCRDSRILLSRPLLTCRNRCISFLYPAVV